MKLLIAAGGTGGHIFPGISVAEAFMAQAAGEVIFTGTPYGLEEKLIPQNGYRLAKIEAKPFSGASVGAKVQTMLAVLRGTLQARRLIKAEKPDAILGMGGFASVPVVLAGLFLRVPCFIHEQNVYPRPGKQAPCGQGESRFCQLRGDRAIILRRSRWFIRAIRSARAMRGKRDAKQALGVSPYSSSAGAGGRGA